MSKRRNQTRSRNMAFAATQKERTGSRSNGMNFCQSQFNKLFLVFAVLIFTSATLSAQAPSRLHGQVIDQTGAVIPGALITLKLSSGPAITAKSDGVGTYLVRDLPPGTYTLTVVEKGFRPHAQQVEISVGQDKKLDITMDVYVKEEQVDVQSDAAKVSVNPDNNASSMIITGKDLDALSDDPDELQSELQALAGPSAGPNGGQIYIDGFTGGQLPPKSSIREIRINQNPFSAQYDRMGFGRIEILTKPGTDKIHGQFSYNDNHSIFDALNPFAAIEPDFSSRIFNGNIGGPLSKKASYFINLERRDINDAAVVLPSAFANAGVPVVAVSNPRVRTNLSSRFDFQVAPSNTLMVRYQFTHDTQDNNGVSQLSLPSMAFNQVTDEHEIQISDTQVLSPHAVNETRFEWEHGNTSQTPLSLTPTINVLGVFQEGGSGQGASKAISDHFELQNYTSVNRGNHFMRMGGRLRVTSVDNTSNGNFNGTFTFGATFDPVTKKQTATPLQNFTNGTPSQFTITAGNPQISNTFADAGLYVEDDWKIRPNLTASLGLRFETQNGINDHADWSPRVGLAWGVGSKKGSQPKTIIRTGFGVFYDRFGQGQILQTLRLNGINQRQFTISTVDSQGNPIPANQTALQTFFAQYPVLPPLSNLTASANNTTYSIAYGLRTPYTMQGAVSVERQLSKASTLSMTYLHSQGVHQFLSINTNAFVVGASPAFQYISEGIFKQNQMIANFNMRASSKLTIFSFYSLSYANSDSFGAGSFPSNPTNIGADYGRAGFDVRSRVFVGGTVGLPQGFRLSPFMIYNTGGPFNITTGQDLNGDSIFNDRPAFASSATAPGNLRATQFGDFDIAPAPGQTRIPANFGNSPGQFTLNLRLSKTFGIGPKLETAASKQDPQNPQAQHRPEGGGGREGGGARGGPGGGGMGGGPRGGGPMGGGGERSSSNRYSLTFSANARNLFNHVNPGAPIGNLSSTQFGQSTSLAGGPFNTQSANRRVDLQVMFAF